MLTYEFLEMLIADAAAKADMYGDVFNYSIEEIEADETGKKGLQAHAAMRLYYLYNDLIPKLEAVKYKIDEIDFQSDILAKLDD